MTAAPQPDFDMRRLIEDLYPICRSITGDGVRATLRRLQRDVDLVIHEVPTGTQVFDWTVPREWSIRDAYIADASGRRVIDFQRNNLHVVGYSVPVRQRMPLSELRAHLHTLPEQPDRVPYRTSYYKENWGFCLAHRDLMAMPEGEYEVCIDSTLAPGSLTYGDLYVSGESSEEVLISTHVCHPSLANDNLSGIAVAIALARQLRSQPHRRLSYRFVFVPGTIGPLAWLAANEEGLANVRHGMVLTCVGDPGKVHYKKSRRGDADVDRAMAKALRDANADHEILEFSPYGYDERQYCSPGFNLPVGCLMRSVHGTFPEYHTSADNLEFLSDKALAGTFSICLAAFEILDTNRSYQNLSPKGEPQLGKRGLYRSTGGSSLSDDNLAMLWVLNQSDGSNSLLEIAERANMPYRIIASAAEALATAGLIAPAAH